MTAKKPGRSTKSNGLRPQAEGRLRTTRRDVAAMPIKDVQRLVHELQVHQIELEMQNEELRRTQVELEAARDRYVDLYDCAPTGYLTLDPKGMILEANLPACRLFGMNGKDLRGQPMTRFVAATDQTTFLRHIRELVSTETKQACEVDLARHEAVPVTIWFESVVIQDATGQHPRLFTALLDITERKRRERISHDLHDATLQSLYAIGLSLETCKLYFLEAPDKAEAILTQSIGELRSEMREVRTFIEELESGSLPETT